MKPLRRIGVLQPQDEIFGVHERGLSWFSKLSDIAVICYDRWWSSMQIHEDCACRAEPNGHASCMVHHDSSLCKIPHKPSPSLRLGGVVVDLETFGRNLFQGFSFRSWPSWCCSHLFWIIQTSPNLKNLQMDRLSLHQRVLWMGQRWAIWSWSDWHHVLKLCFNSAEWEWRHGGT